MCGRAAGGVHIDTHTSSYSGQGDAYINPAMRHVSTELFVFVSYVEFNNEKVKEKGVPFKKINK